MENTYTQDKKIFIFDLDDTLINTRLLKKLRFNIFKNAGYTDEEILVAYEAIYASGYTPEKHLAALQYIRNNPAITLISDDHLHTEDLIFADTKTMLTEIKNNPQTYCILLTKGNAESQMKKVNLLGLKNFFDEIWTDAGPKIDFLKTKFSTDVEFIFINDRIEENEKIKKEFFNAHFYLIDRHGIHTPGTAYTSLTDIQKEVGV